MEKAIPLEFADSSSNLVDTSDASRLASETASTSSVSLSLGEQKVKADLSVLSHLEDFTTGALSEEDLDIIADNLDNRTADEALEIVLNAIEEHMDDPCLDKSRYDNLIRLSSGVCAGDSQELWEAEIKFEAFMIADWSIYPDVRAVTRPIDELDPDGYENFRVYLIAIVWSCAGSVLATFFAVRYPSIYLTPIALEILIAYSGHCWGKLTKSPWTFKEQMLATLIMAVGASNPYSQDAIISQSNENFYGIADAKSFGYIVMLTLSSQFMGFGVAGIMRSFLVYPVRCVWYIVLPGIAISRTLTTPEAREKVNGWTLRGSEFFWLVTALFFAWYWVTNLLFQALAYFSWPAWIAPDNVSLQALTGCFSGLAINPLPSFDISIFQPTALVTPWYVQVNSFVGMVIAGVAIIIIWYTNVRWTGYLPINTNGVYANDGDRYHVRKVLNSKSLLDLEKYQQYSLPFWSAGNLVVYGAYFLLYPAMIVFAILNYGKPLLRSLSQFGKSIFVNPGKALEEHTDRFSRAQRRYKEVPEWWFLATLAGSLALAIATVEYYSFTNTPVWTIFLGVGLSLVFLIPTGYLAATTNTTFMINVLFELVIGCIIPGNGNALMVSKVYGANFLNQTDSYLSNQAAGHYCGISPRSLFRGQMLSTLCNTFVQAGLMYWQASGGIEDMCDPKNKQRLTCLNQQSYFSAAVQWGTVGPQRVFKGLYPSMKWCFLIGAFFPIPVWLLRKASPRLNRWLVNVNEMIILSGALSWAPSNFMYSVPPMYLGAAFQYYIKRHYPRWWSKYTYLLVAGIQVAINYSALVLFFSTQYNHIVNIDWWGNNVQVNTGDFNETAVRLTIPTTRGYFGPDRGTFP